VYEGLKLVGHELVGTTSSKPHQLTHLLRSICASVTYTCYKQFPFSAKKLISHANMHRRTKYLFPPFPHSTRRTPPHFHSQPFHHPLHSLSHVGLSNSPSHHLKRSAEKPQPLRYAVPQQQLSCNPPPPLKRRRRRPQLPPGQAPC
jgi:hypothetical protein